MTRTSRCSTSWQLRTESQPHLPSIASARHAMMLGCRTRSLPSNISAPNCFSICSSVVKHSFNKTTMICGLLMVCRTGLRRLSEQSWMVCMGQLQTLSSHPEPRTSLARRSLRSPLGRQEIILVLPRWLRTKFFAILWPPVYRGKTAAKTCSSWPSSAKLSHVSANSMLTTCVNPATQSNSNRALFSPSSQDEWSQIRLKLDVGLYPLDKNNNDYDQSRWWWCYTCHFASSSS